MNFLSGYLNLLPCSRVAYAGFRIILILIFGGGLTIVIKKVLTRLQKRLIQQEAQAEGEPITKSAKRIETISVLFRQAISIVIGLMIFKELGIEIAPLIASAGIIGLAVGFGTQNLMWDVISRFFIIMEK